MPSFKRTFPKSPIHTHARTLYAKQQNKLGTLGKPGEIPMKTPKPQPPGPSATAITLLESRPPSLTVEAWQWPDLADAITSQGGQLVSVRTDGGKVTVCLAWLQHASKRKAGHDTPHPQ